MIENIFVKIIFFIFIGVIIYLIYNFFNQQYLQENLRCNIDNLDIDDLFIIERTPEYSKLINGLIDEKSFIFSDDKLKVLKNPQQIFDISNNKNNSKDNLKDNSIDISNISDIVYLGCGKQLVDNTFDFNNDKNNEIKVIEENFNNIDDLSNFNDIVDVSSKEYTDIKNMLSNDIKQFIGPNCFNTGVLKQNIPLIKNYLKNYYQDLYGNKVDAELKDYFIAYYTLMNNPNDVGLPVDTLVGTSDFIIPDQYKTDSNFTNAYNIDWNRIINPISYS